MKDFAVIASGFPAGRTGEEQLEDEYGRFFRDAFPLKVFAPEQRDESKLFEKRDAIVGVVICWDLYNYKGDVDFEHEVIDVLDELDRERDGHSRKNEKRSSTVTDLSESTLEEEKRGCQCLQMRCIDPILLRLYLGLPATANDDERA